MLLNRTLTTTVLAVGATLSVPLAHANLPVIDVTNLAQNLVTAITSVSNETTQDTNLIYQYKMMGNQLLQATKLADVATAGQLAEINSDMSKMTQYATVMKQVYDGLQSDGQYVNKVQTLVNQSGKTPDQWFADQSTLLKTGDKNATQLFQQGTDIQKHMQDLAQRRQQIQNQLNLSPTQQATAQLTTHMLDVVASQQSDMLQLMATSAQQQASKQTAQNTEDEQNIAAQQAIAKKRQAESNALLPLLGE